MLSEISQTDKTHTLRYYLYVLFFLKGNFKGTKDNIVTARDSGKA